MTCVRLLLITTLLMLVGCAHVTIKSELAPDVILSKQQPLYLESPANLAISHQKYVHILKESLKTQGFNMVEDSVDALYVMAVNFNDFMGKLNHRVPTVETSVTSGRVGNASVHGMTTTYGSESVEKQIPTHNSIIYVTDKKTGRLVWQVLIAKSYDIYDEAKLKTVLSSALSLYGKEGDASKMISDEARW